MVLMELTVVFQNTRSTLTFDSIPTYTTVRKAISSDVVGSDNFTMVGTTARGSQVPIKDSLSFTRTLGPRQDMEVLVTETLKVPSGGISTLVEPAPVLLGGSSGSRTQSTSRPVVGSKTTNMVTGGEGVSFRRTQGTTNDAPTTPLSLLSGGGNPSTTASGAGIQCDNVIEHPNDIRVMACVRQPGRKGGGGGSTKIWMAEKDTGTLLKCNANTGAVETRLTPFPSLQQTNAVKEACLCLHHLTKEEVRSSTVAGHIWAGFLNKYIVVFDASTGANVKSLLEHSGAVFALASSCGFIFSASQDFTVLQWNPDTFTVCKLLAKHSNAVRALAVSPTKLFSGADDKSLMMWNPTTGEAQKQAQNAHPAAVRSLECFHGKLWSGAQDGSIRVWNADNFELLKSFSSFEPQPQNIQSQQQPFFHQAEVIAIRKFNTKILTFSMDKKMMLFDAIDVKCLGPILHPHESVISSLAIVGQVQMFRFWTAGYGRRICRWSLEDSSIGSGNPSTPEELMDNHDDGDDENNDAEQFLQDQVRMLEAKNQELETEQQVLMQQMQQQKEEMLSENKKLKQQPPVTTAPVVAGPSSSGSSSGLGPSQLVRLEFEASNEHQLLLTQEGKAWAELLLLERVRRSQFEIPTRRLKIGFTSSALHSFDMTWNSALQIRYEVFSAWGQHLRQLAVGSLASERATLRVLDEYKASQEHAQQTQQLLKEQLKGAHDERNALHEAHDQIQHDFEKKKMELKASENARQTAYDGLTRAQDELRALQKRHADLETQHATSVEEGIQANRTHEKEMREMRQKHELERDQLREENNDLSIRSEKAEREVRTLTQEHKSAVEKAESVLRRSELQSREYAEERKFLSEQIESERHRFQMQLRDHEEAYDSLKINLTKEVQSYKSDFEVSNRQLREANTKIRQLEDDVDQLKRKVNVLTSEKSEEAETLRGQLEDARNGWKSEVEVLESSLSDKISQLSRSEKKCRELESYNVKLQSANSALTRQADSNSSENTRLSEKVQYLQSEESEKTATLEQSLVSFRDQVQLLEGQLKSERQAKGEAERRLQGIEENYELVRRRHAEELDVLREENARLLHSEQQKHHMLQENDESTIKELQSQLQQKNREVDILESGNRELSNELSAAKELNEYVNKKLQQKQNEYEEMLRSLEDDRQLLQRTCDGRRAEIDTLSERLRQEMDHEASAVNSKMEELENAYSQLRESQQKVFNAEAKVEKMERKLQDAHLELQRVKEQLEIEKGNQEEGHKESGQVIDSLRSELNAARQKVQDGILGSEALFRQIHELEDQLNLTRGDADRSVLRIASQLEEKEKTIETLTKECQNYEKILSEQSSSGQRQDRDRLETLTQKEKKIASLETEVRILSEKVASAKENSDIAAHRCASLLEEKESAMQKIRAERDGERHHLNEKILQLQSQIQNLQREVTKKESELKLAEEVASREIKMADERRVYLQCRVDDLERQVSAQEQESSEVVQRLSAHHYSEQEEAQKKLDSFQTEQSMQKQQLLTQLESTKQALQLATAEGHQRRIDLEAKNENEERLTRQYQLDLQEKQATAQRLQSELDVHKKLAAQRKEELDSYAKRHQEETAQMLKLLAEKAEELEASKVEIQNKELELVASQVNKTKEGQTSQEQGRKIDLLEERLRKDKSQNEAHEREWKEGNESLRKQLSEVREELQNKIFELEASQRNERSANEKLQVQTEENVRWQQRLDQSTKNGVSAIETESKMRRQLEDRLKSEEKAFHAKEEEQLRELVKLRTTLADKETLCAQLTSENEKLSERRDDNAMQLTQRQREHLSETKQLMHENTEMTTQLRQYKLKSETVDADIAERDGEIVRLSRELQEKQNEIREMMESSSGATQEKSKMKKEFSLREEETVTALKRAEEKNTNLESLLAKVMEYTNYYWDVAAVTLFWTDNYCSEKNDVILESGLSLVSHVLAQSQADHDVATVSQLEQEIQRLLHESQKNKEAEKKHQLLLDQNSSLINEVRAELSALFQRYKQECENHDKTRVELMQVKGLHERSQSAGARLLELQRPTSSSTVTEREEFNHLRSIIATLEAEREALRARLEVTSTSSSFRQVAVNRSPSPFDPNAASRNSGELVTFLLQTRQDLIEHIVELIKGIKEATRLMYQLDQTPPLVPDTMSLVCVYGWLNSARRRGDVLVQTMLTVEERASIT